MPEGAEVRRVADALHDKISGKWIHNIKVNDKSRYRFLEPTYLYLMFRLHRLKVQIFHAVAGKLYFFTNCQ